MASEIGSNPAEKSEVVRRDRAAFALEWMGRCYALVEELRDQGLVAELVSHNLGVDSGDGIVITITIGPHTTAIDWRPAPVS